VNDCGLETRISLSLKILKTSCMKQMYVEVEPGTHSKRKGPGQGYSGLGVVVNWYLKYVPGIYLADQLWLIRTVYFPEIYGNLPRLPCPGGYRENLSDGTPEELAR